MSCHNKNCTKYSMYNYQNSKPKYCAKHKEIDMINVKNKRCLFDECDKIAGFNYIGEKGGKYCAKHKKDNMIDIKHKRCLFDGCNIQPSFNYEREKSAVYCMKHKKNNMIIIINIKCLSKDCNIQASFNYEDEKVAKYCAKHKKDNMINIKHKRCLFDDCNIQASFNYEDEKVVKYCAKHKKDSMIDIKHKRCLFNGCNKVANFNYKDEKEGKYCLEHKKDNMINILNKMCLFDDCNIRASYNYEGKKTGKYCMNHKKDNMINVIAKKCISVWCDTIVKNKYEGYCLYCYINLFPNKQVSKNYKTKEKAVTEYILKNLSSHKWVIDKKIQNGISKRRPDLLLNLDNQIIIIEIDENKHNNYNCICENKRIMEISKDVNHKNIIFIRFNPDNYINSNGTRIKSCWTMTKTGTMKINNKKEWENRLLNLKNHTEYWINNSTNKLIETIELYYNQN